MTSSTVLHIDLETFSAIDLRKAGAAVYAEDESTDVWCACFAWDGDADVQVWRPGQPPPDAVIRHVKNGGVVAAHNAAFERTLIHYVLAPRYGWPEPRYDQWRCTAAMAACMALPRSLGEAAWVVGQADQKDDEGHKLMMQMSKPRRRVSPNDKEWPGLFAELVKAGGRHPGLKKLSDGSILVLWYTSKSLDRLIDYCKKDVLAEMGLDKRLRPLSEFEQRLFILDAKINDRGLLVDHASIRNAQEIIATSTGWLTEEMQALTGGLKPSQRGAIVEWLESKGMSYARIEHKPKATAEDAPDEEAAPAEIEALDKEALESMLARDNLAPDVRRVLEIRLEAGKSAHTKLEAMIRRSNRDGRIRGNFLYAGAHTLRFSGQGVQFQNLMRPSGKFDLLSALDEIVAGTSAEMIQCFYGPPLSIVGENTRGFIIAEPGKEFIAGDFSNIEGRVNAFLHAETTKLEAFRAYDAGTGPDLYNIMAASILNKRPDEVTKEERQIYGKVPELACGYQGGLGAFAKMGKNYGVRISDEEAAPIVKGWRAANANITSGWYCLQDAAFRAVENPGTVCRPLGRHDTPVGATEKVAFVVHGAFLWARMPSGGLLAYARPEIREVSRKVTVIDPDTGEKREETVTRPAVTFWAVDSQTKKWKRQAGYGGQWDENFVQRIARDVLAEAMLRVDEKGYKIVLHAHDEIVIEEPKDSVDLTEYETLMAVKPEWLGDCPIAVSGWIGPRYRK